MLTEQDIKEVVFTKSLGGYKTSEVDAFWISVPRQWLR